MFKIIIKFEYGKYWAKKNNNERNSLNFAHPSKNKDRIENCHRKISNEYVEISFQFESVIDRIRFDDIEKVKV